MWTLRCGCCHAHCALLSTSLQFKPPPDAAAGKSLQDAGGSCWSKESLFWLIWTFEFWLENRGEVKLQNCQEFQSWRTKWRLFWVVVEFTMDPKYTKQVHVALPCLEQANRSSFTPSTTVRLSALFSPSIFMLFERFLNIQISIMSLIIRLDKAKKSLRETLE